MLTISKFRYWLLVIFLGFSAGSVAQHVTDSVSIITDPREIVASHPYFNFKGSPVRLTISERKTLSHDSIFYYIIGLFFYIALMRLIFQKYMSTMFTLFFRATMRQQQLREQMLQSPLPALLMNIFFVMAFATYGTLLAHHLDLPFATGFWSTLLFAIVIFLFIYAGKYILLNIAGWIFGISNAMETYLFIVFLINKMMALFLLPFIALMAFPARGILPVVISVSYLMVVAMFIYRFIISYRPVRIEIKLSRLQFFLYLCAFEIAPLLLIYKVLLTFEVSRL